MEAETISFDEDLETVAFAFAQEIPAGSDVVIFIEFEGIHNDQLAGFYRSSYTDYAGEKRHLVITQFQSTDCRRCFPSFDEPALKATFSSSLIVDRHLVALSNTAEISSINLEIDSIPKKQVTFKTTPKMSTYLVAYVVGELDFIETVVNPPLPANSHKYPVRVYTIKGKAVHGKYALSLASKVLEFFSEYFDEPYSLTK
ncbi:Aminopeptidase 2 mitochondrial, partial [Physocladia obscura]